jgi:peptidoglycan hydrolase CwlO-like protein
VPEESQAELETLLERLENEEREISALRRKIHDRLASFPNEVTEKQEREVSQKRRELHAQIDELRVRIRHLQGR